MISFLVGNCLSLIFLKPAFPTRSKFRHSSLYSAGTTYYDTRTNLLAGFAKRREFAWSFLSDLLLGGVSPGVPCTAPGHIVWGL